MPEVDALYLVGLLSRLAHIISATLLVGGLVYLRMMVVPVQREAPEGGDSAQQYFLGLRKRWAVCVMICSALLIVSGLYNFIVKNRAYDLPGAYHGLFGTKFLLGVVVIFAASILAGRTSAAQRARSRMATLLNWTIACAVVVIILASILRTFNTPKPSNVTAHGRRLAPQEDRARTLHTPHAVAMHSALHPQESGGTPARPGIARLASQAACPALLQSKC